MISRAKVEGEKPSVWAELAAPLNPNDLAWRADGKPTARDGKFFARYVVYVEAGTVRERLDSVVPGEWDLTLEAQSPLPYTADEDTSVSFKARLQILGVIREDVGTGKDYKQAATDAFKRVAVRFGIGHELYAFEQNWVQVDSDSKYAKPVEDPQKAYEKRHGSGAEKIQAAATQASPAPREGAAGESTPGPTSAPTNDDLTACPKCGGRTWDNRTTKRNPKAPDYKCQNRSCDGVIWPPKEEKNQPVAAGTARGEDDGYMDAVVDDGDLPF